MADEKATPVPEMVERVAKAMAAEFQNPEKDDIYDWETQQLHAEDLVECARAAIEAMREPTKDMSIAGGDLSSPGYGTIQPSPRERWRSMIGTALGK